MVCAVWKEGVLITISSACSIGESSRPMLRIYFIESRCFPSMPLGILNRYRLEEKTSKMKEYDNAKRNEIYKTSLGLRWNDMMA